MLSLWRRATTTATPSSLTTSSRMRWMGLKDGQLVGTVAIILKVCGGQLDNFAISHSTARRQREIVNSMVAMDIMIKWVKLVMDMGLKIILHLWRNYRGIKSNVSSLTDYQ